MKGIIFNIQRFCVQDGPGIRTAVFFKGCPLRCAWCHNPEGLSSGRQVLFDARKCCLCGACAAACRLHVVEDSLHRYERNGCVACGRCVSVCETGALELAGREESVDSVMQTVLRDMPFYRQSGGGMTLTGGEPTAQVEFAIALARSAREENISVCVETCGFCAEEKILALAEVTDLFLFDVKETDPIRHKAYTGQDNAPILRNLRALDEKGLPTILRCPVIPGYNDREAHFAAVGALADSLLNVRGVELEPYHPLGLSKAEMLGMRASAGLDEHMMPREHAEEFLKIVRAHTSVPATIQ